MRNGLTSSLSSGVERFTFVMNLFNRPLLCSVACQNCQEFSFRGSAGYTIRRACLRCGHSSTEKREEKPQFKLEDCPRESTDNRESSRLTHRAWCKQCCSFIDELPVELRRERVALAKAVESTAQDKVSIIEAIARDDQDVFTPETTVGRIFARRRLTP